MYAGQILECREMKEWEERAEANKYTVGAKVYFEEIVKDNKTYALNSSGSAKDQVFESMAHVKSREEEDGDELHRSLSGAPRQQSNYQAKIKNTPNK